MAPAICVESLSKRFRINHAVTGQQRPAYRTLRESLYDTLKAPLRNLSQGAALGEVEDFWALHDVNFQVNHGEVVGIIGRNGAGKSTLLKILSRITEPTSGRVRLRGRVGSLLEVGTGFHPELTGRENIFLNGSILGMSRRDMRAKFDEIVDFSGVEKFIDTPVKRFSSGMKVRLAFSVAAHLEPEILLIDEVLAVGDVVFQKKCLGKMDEVAAGGRTVLFVSHDMSGVLKLCGRGILLREGRIWSDGPARDVIDEYIRGGLESHADTSWERDPAAPGPAQLKAVRVLDKDGDVAETHYLADPIVIEIQFWCNESGVRLNPSIHVLNSHGVCVFATANLEHPDWGRGHYQRGLYRAYCTIPGHLLNDGDYRVSVFVSRNARDVFIRQNELVSFHVIDDGSARGDYTGGWIGVIRPEIPWNVEPVPEQVVV